MKRVLTTMPEGLPEAFIPYAQQAAIYDSSCSNAARVWFLDKDSGFFLKRSPKGSLAKEVAMTSFFHSKGLGAEVLGYETGDFDWLLTRRVAGEDCTWSSYLDDPRRLCDTTAHLLRSLHEIETDGCPITNRTADYLVGAEKNYQAGIFSNEFLPQKWKQLSAREAWENGRQAGTQMKADTLLHGDYCLPNIMLDHWQFSGFIDLDGGGVGDRHIDLFWGIWSLEFNLKTDQYAQRFLDAYGREVIDTEMLAAIAFLETFG